jgi:hypothetical protein
MSVKGKFWKPTRAQKVRFLKQLRSDLESSKALGMSPSFIRSYKHLIKMVEDTSPIVKPSKAPRYKKK